jgi:GNAT superfamily N-acetyltransferase
MNESKWNRKRHPIRLAAGLADLRQQLSPLRTAPVAASTAQDGDSRFHCQPLSGASSRHFIFWWDCGEQIYIEHLAINPALRGQNHGSRLLAAFCETAGRPVIWR